jgi:hypothetical protein
MRYYLASVAVFVIPSTAFAQAPQHEAGRVVGLVCIAALLALLVGLLVFLGIFVRQSGAMRTGEHQGIARDHIERMNAHIARQEERELRIIELLESIEVELKHRDSIKKL